jgi:hypothetical protein
VVVADLERKGVLCSGGKQLLAGRNQKGRKKKRREQVATNFHGLRFSFHRLDKADSDPAKEPVPRGECFQHRDSAALRSRPSAEGIVFPLAAISHLPGERMKNRLSSRLSPRGGIN